MRIVGHSVLRWLGSSRLGTLRSRQSGIDRRAARACPSKTDPTPMAAPVGATPCPSDFTTTKGARLDESVRTEDRPVPQRGARVGGRSDPGAPGAQISITPSGRLSQPAGEAPKARRGATPTGCRTRPRRARRRRRLQAGGHPGIGVAESVLSQVLAITKTPFDLVRGSSGEEKLLKNAKDDCAAEALEIATYTALRELAEAAGGREDGEACRDDPGRGGAHARAPPHRDPASLTPGRGRRRLPRRSDLRPHQDGAADAPVRARGAHGRGHGGERRRGEEEDRPPGAQGPGRRRGRGRGQGRVADADDLPITATTT